MGSDHSAHVARHNKSAVKPYRALEPRICDDCGETICCFYGQKTIEDEAAPCGVWLLHYSCGVPRKKGPTDGK